MRTAAEYPVLAIFLTEDDVDDSIKVAFESRYGVRLCTRLGFGRDGDVYLTDRNTAVKFFKLKDGFLREREVYEVLARLRIEQIAGHAVPEMLNADEAILALEMTVVQAPFLLDFVSAYPIAEAPDFSEEVWEHWQEEKCEQFEDRWPQAQYVMAEFQRLTGFVLLDVNAGNIGFPQDSQTAFDQPED